MFVNVLQATKIIKIVSFRLQRLLSLKDGQLSINNSGNVSNKKGPKPLKIKEALLKANVWARI